MKNLYKILGVAKDATQKEIKTAYRELSKKHHPDKQGGDTNLFAQIAEAYEVLSDESKRDMYDQTGKIPGANKNHAKLAGLIETLFIPMIYKYHDSPQLDLIKQFIIALERMIDLSIEASDNIAKDLGILIISKTKISTSSEDTLIIELLESKINSLSNSINQAKEEIEFLKWCINYMQHYKYKVTEQIKSSDDIASEVYKNMSPGRGVQWNVE